jgi:hypothetical protein
VGQREKQRFPDLSAPVVSGLLACIRDGDARLLARGVCVARGCRHARRFELFLWVRGRGSFPGFPFCFPSRGVQTATKL